MALGLVTATAGTGSIVLYVKFFSHLNSELSISLIVSM
jgi:hypothetical protein